MADTTNRSRVQAGVPTGGEFARETKAENPDLPVVPAVLDEDEWDATFNPTESPSGEMVWEYDEVKDKPLNNVWSLVEGDDGGIYASPGFHVVNMIGYSVTENPWTNELGDGVWQAASDEEDDYDPSEDDRDTEDDPHESAPRPGLNAVQERLLSNAESVGPITLSDGSVYEPGLLVSGNEYKTALALERRGYGTVRYQGPSMGWLYANKPEETE